ncbi:MAG: ABC transporter ATP-binding protein [Pseudomonadota bacterium]
MLLSVENLSKSFGDKGVLKSINMEVAPGPPVALIGPNGAGKTTLFSIIAGFLNADSGKVLLNNSKLPSPAQFGQIAVLPQDAQLDPRFSIDKQLRFFCRLQGLSARQSEQEVSRVLELVDMAAERKKKPQQLSHGMRKRVCIAQALIGEPRLVLLDEATAGLDPIHARSIRELIANLAGEVTFILSSHDLAELERLCERVFVFSDGKLTHYLNVNEASDNNKVLSKTTEFLTLRTRIPLPEQYVSELEAMANVQTVSLTQNREYLIEYTKTGDPFDISLLQFLHGHRLEYQQIYNGKTLENKLFQNEMP